MNLMLNKDHWLIFLKLKDMYTHCFLYFKDFKKDTNWKDFFSISLKLLYFTKNTQFNVFQQKEV